MTIRVTRRWTRAIVCCGALLAACSSEDSSGESIAVKDVWTRVNAQTATMGAVYMKLERADGDRLVSASVANAIAGKTEQSRSVLAKVKTQPEYQLKKPIYDKYEKRLKDIEQRRAAAPGP